jgi:hypothetical protein
MKYQEILENNRKYIETSGNTLIFQEIPRKIISGNIKNYYEIPKKL